MGVGAHGAHVGAAGGASISKKARWLVIKTKHARKRKRTISVAKSRAEGRSHKCTIGARPPLTKHQLALPIVERIGRAPVK